ncbi:unnamed protein product, partial [Anisakis simplex]|uniref:WGR domain-containing protein n=1 Tax=Anisakis simplex TaxID=6269 RepID=A0A0M3JB46_ANISI
MTFQPAVDISNIMVQYDVKADSERFLARDTEAKAEAIKRDRANALLRPHRNSGYERTGEICTAKFDGSDEEVLYKVMLTKTDLSYGLYGFHNYYRMELIKRKGSDLHILFTNWGRIGDANGQYQRTPFGSLAAGHDEFCSVFRSKTGNDFTNIANFEEKPNKYRLVTADPNAAIDFSDLTIELDTDQTQAIMDIDSVYKFIRD